MVSFGSAELLPVGKPRRELSWKGTSERKRNRSGRRRREGRTGFLGGAEPEEYVGMMWERN